ncbi:MAG: tRNA adenosine(34) deaminase TadA [Wenzhouxiangella sp.]
MSKPADAPTDQHWMHHALGLAGQAEAIGEVPVGAVLVRGDEVLGEGFNTLIRDHDPSAHAEMIAIRAAAARMGNYRLPGTTLYVTLEPCAMCAGAIVQARIDRVVYGADDPRTGAARSVFQILDNPALNHRCAVTGGVLAEESGQMLRAFFRARR